jgi:hypothetical protein
MVKMNVVEGNRSSNPVGLQDGGHIYIKCSACRKPLVDIWITKPNLLDITTNKPFQWKAIAYCCYCGDHSFETTWYGGFVWGGFGENCKEDPDASFEKTAIDRVENQWEEVMHIYTKKVER